MILNTMKILIVSDIHANIFGLKKALNESYDKAIFLGDAVDYGPFPGETLDTLRENFEILIMGNHDYATAYGVDCKCGEDNHDLSVFTRENITKKLLSKEDLEFIKKFRESYSIESGGNQYNLYHGAPWDHLYGYIYPWVGDSLKTSGLFGTDDGDFFIVGHSHYQFLTTKGGKTFINPGSIGQPRDIKGLTSYLILETEDDSKIFKRVKYDREPIYQELEKLIDDDKMLQRAKAMF